MSKSYKSRSIKISPITISLVTSLLMLVMLFLFMGNRSVYLDEANLMRNISERSFWELASPLDYDQSAPLLYTWLVNIFANAAPTTTLFRLVPLFLVLTSIRILSKLYTDIFPSWIGIGLIAYYGLHELVLQYGTECKQYGGDLFITALLIWAVHNLPISEKRNLKWWVLIGVLGQFLSMPAILVLTGVGLYWLYQYKNDQKLLVHIVGVGITWVIAFVINYLLILGPGISSPHMQDYHEKYFLSFGNTDQLVGNLMTYIRLIAKKTAIGIGSAGLLVGLGIYHLVRIKDNKVIVYLAPILLTIILASIGK